MVDTSKTSVDKDVEMAPSPPDSASMKSKAEGRDTPSAHADPKPANNESTPDHEKPSQENKENENDDDGGEDYEVHFDGDSDPTNPKNRTETRKWFIVLILSTSAVCVTCASAVYTSTYKQLEQEFGISREVATVGLTIFVIGYAETAHWF